MSSQEENLVHQLFMILQNKKPLSDIETVLAPRFTICMDNDKWEATPQIWQDWVCFLRHRGRLTHVNAVLEEIKMNKDQTYTLTGYWVGKYKGEQVKSNLAQAHYSFENGRVTTIWTSRKNYAFFLKL